MVVSFPSEDGGRGSPSALALLVAVCPRDPPEEVLGFQGCLGSPALPPSLWVRAVAPSLQGSPPLSSPSSESTPWHPHTPYLFPDPPRQSCLLPSLASSCPVPPNHAAEI